MTDKPDGKRWLGFILCGLVGAFAGYLVTSIALILVLMVGDGFNALFWSIPVTLLSGALLGAWAGLKTLSRLAGSDSASCAGIRSPASCVIQPRRQGSES
jgi:hypothetical protein